MKYTITENNGMYTASIPLPMIDGRTLLIQGSASVGEVMREFGISDEFLAPSEVGVFEDYSGSIYDNPRFKALTPKQQKIADALQDAMFHKPKAVQRRMAEEAEKKAPWLDRVLHYRGEAPKGFLHGLGKFFKGIAKSKALRKALKIAKDIVKSPITTAALGIVTGGAAIPALTAANAAIRIAEAAKLTGKKGQAARKVIRASLQAADKPPSGAIPSRQRQPDPKLQAAVQRINALKAGATTAASMTTTSALARVPDLIVKLTF